MKEKSQKIMILIADLGSGGAQKVSAALAEYLAKKEKYSVIFVTLKNNDNDDFFSLSNSIERLALGLTKESGSFLEGFTKNVERIYTIRSLIKNHNISHVISFIAPTNILAIMATRFLNVKLIISERNDPSRQSFGMFWDYLRIKLYRYANTVSANSQIAIEAMKKYVPYGKLVFVPNPLSIPAPKYMSKMKQKENIILFVGRLHPQKAVDILLKAFVAIPADWKLVIVGSGQLEKELKELAKNLNIQNRVLFEGQIDNPYKYYEHAKIFVLPSRHEGTPNALLEAMSCGVVPVVSDAAKGALPYVQNQDQVFACDDIDDLSYKLQKIIQKDYALDIASKLAMEAVSELHGKDIFEIWDELL